MKNILIYIFFCTIPFSVSESDAYQKYQDYYRNYYLGQSSMKRGNVNIENLHLPMYHYVVNRLSYNAFNQQRQMFTPFMKTKIRSGLEIVSIIDPSRIRKPSLGGWKMDF